MAEEVSMTNLIGSELPEMEVEAFHNNEIKSINLKDYRGKWVVLVFYPADFTFVCPTELTGFADLYDKFKSENAEILSVSTDTAFVHKAWFDNSPSINKIKYPMIADPTGKLCKALGTYISDEGLSLRGTFIVDPEGKIKAYEIHHNDIGRNPEETLRKIQAAKYVEEHGGEVCPVSWTPGKETLKPGVDLVGKI